MNWHLPKVGREHNRFDMKNNNLIRFVQSLVLLPVMFGGISATKITQNALISKTNIEVQGSLENLAFNQAPDPRAVILKIKADAIDAYFKARNMPLHGLGMKMVLEAEKNGIDWRLLPAIAVRESTGGKYDCNRVPNNAFGWGSCKISFKSPEEAIETVARNLGGNNPNTARYYDNKTTKQILQKYNPPSIVPHYAQQVISIMNKIGPEDTAITTIEKINANT